MIPNFVRVALAVALLGVVGCGGDKTVNPSDYGGAEGLKIATLIGDFDDLKNDARKIGTAFAAGAAPKGADYRKFGTLGFHLVGKPTVTGDTATAKVSVEKPATGEKVGETEWAFVKEGEAWKIKAAPLP